MVPAEVFDPRRLAVVETIGLIDTVAEPVFDELTRTVARLLQAPLAFLTVVDDERSFWKSAHGVDDAQSNTVSESFCQYVIERRDDLLVDDTASDPMTMHNPSVESMNVRAWAGCPIMVSNHVVGTFCVVDHHARTWSGDDQRILQSFSDVVSREFQHRHDRAGSAAAHLQDSEALELLRAELTPGSLPTVENIEIAAWFEPASDGNDVLGDFYDVFPLDDGAWGIGLGDVCGHGVEAARLTALLRYTLRAAAIQHSDPADALMELDRAVLRARPSSGMFATACYARLAVSGDQCTVDLALSGHPPPALRRRDGATGFLDPVPGSPVGIETHTRPATLTLTLDPGDALVFYTDGLSESRSPQRAQLGEQQILKAIEPIGDGSASILAALRAALEAQLDGGHRHDDTAIVVARFAP